jgi:hypothetical protein
MRSKKVLVLLSCMALSVAIHALVIYFSGQHSGGWKKAVSSAYDTQDKNQKVHIIWSEKIQSSKKEDVTPAASVATRSTQKKLSSKSPANKTYLPERTFRTAYESMIPSGIDQLESDGRPENSKKMDAEILVLVEGAAQDFGTHIDIPLVFRKNNNVAKAIAKISVKPVKASLVLVIEYLNGESHLRAVLFEALRKKDNQRAIYDMLAAMKRTELLISLRQASILTEGAGGLQSAIHFEGYKLVIDQKVFVSRAFKSPGFIEGAAVLVSIPLPDMAAEKADRRDRAHLGRLTESPAYISPIKNYVLGTFRAGYTPSTQLCDIPCT